MWCTHSCRAYKWKGRLKMLCTWEVTDGRFCDRYTEMVESNLFLFLWHNSPNRAYATSLLSFPNVTKLDTHTHTHTNTHTHTHTHTHTNTHTAGLLWKSDQPVAENTTYTTNNKHKGRTSMPSAGLESAIPAIDRLQTHALDRTSTMIGKPIYLSASYREQFFMVQQPYASLCFLTVEPSRSHSARQTTLRRTPLDEWSNPLHIPLPENTHHSQ
jgi:hypothetical protein